MKLRIRYVVYDAIESGFHVLADKPMVIHPQEFNNLETAFRSAAE